MSMQSRLHATALTGLLGAILMLAGDALLYAHGSTNPDASIQVLERVPLRETILLAQPIHLHLSALLGALASIALLGGACHIYLRLECSSRVWATIAAMAYAFAVILGGTYHARWSLYGFTLQFAAKQTEVPNTLVENVANTMQYFDALLMPLTFLALGTLLVRIVLGKSDYPRWMALLTPLPLILLSGVFLNDLAEALPQPYGALAKGMYFNLVMAAFFLASVLCPSRVHDAGPQ